MDADTQLPRQVLHLHAALAFQHRLEVLQAVHRRGVAAHPAPAAAGATLAGGAGHLLHHEIKTLALGRHLPLADCVDGVGNIAQGVRHGGELPRRTGKPLCLYRRRGRRKDPAHHAAGQCQCRRHPHPGADGQRHHTHCIGRGQRPQRTAHRKHPGAAAALPRAEAGRRQAAHRNRQRRKGPLRPGRRERRRQRNAQHGGLLQRAADGRAEPRRRRQHQARSQGPDGTALQTRRPHGQPEADAPRLPHREGRKRPPQPGRQQGRAPHRGRLGKIYKAPQQKNLHQLCRCQCQATRQRPGAGSAVNQPPHRSRRHRRHTDLNAQQRGLEHHPRRQRADRRRQTVGGRAADNQRQPERCRPAVDPPRAQQYTARQRSPLPQQRRRARPRQQTLHIFVQSFPTQYSHRYPSANLQCMSGQL